MTETEKSTSGKPRKNRRLFIQLLTGLIVLGSAAAGICAYINRPNPPVGVELSRVRGVGIVRRSRWHSRQIANVELNDRRSSRIYRDGYALIHALCDAADQQYPIVQLVELPAGCYRVSASTEKGGQDMLLGLLCAAYEEAFGVEIAVREIETDVFVMTCPDHEALKLRLSARRHPYFKGDFADTPNGGRSDRTWYGVEFACDMDNLASYSAYMMRKAYDAQRPAMRDRLLATAIVNETDMTGLYEGTLSWKFYDHDALIDQLGEAGLKLTLAKRKVKALVVASRP
ncbi:MAG: hypothetical protein IH624_15235 [Phycisphaerae bacterium]|nr:hypothetical protein [Phycisphaerae bacterium]